MFKKIHIKIIFIYLTVSKCLSFAVYKTENNMPIAGTFHSYQWIDDTRKPKYDVISDYSNLVKCKGEYLNGRCFCFNFSGLRIFGWSWWNSSNYSNMTCACSYRVNKLKEKRKDVSLHCTTDGNYEELQCDNGLCWCAEPLTGQPTQRIYPESVIFYLPCYNKQNIGSQYLRQCESKSIARAKILKQMRFHGHIYFQLDSTLCDSDGSYYRYQIDHNVVRCTWKDGKQIYNYQKPISNIAEMNCNCGRDTLIYKEADLEFRLTCKDNGNYEPEQYINGQPFCVDEDGFPTTDIGNIGENMNCVEDKTGLKQYNILEHYLFI